MAKFKKKIVSPGVKTVGRLDGRSEMDAITPDRIKTWVENTKKLQELGVLIPAPFSHQDKNQKFAFPVVKAADGETLSDAYSGLHESIPPAWDLASVNAGFWEGFDIDPTDGSLLGEVEVPGDENDQNTYAGKVGKTVKQTSVLVMPGRKIVGKDGQEHEVGEHLAHVALCLHAQEPGQANFEPISPVPTSLAMSFVLPSLAMDDICDPTAGGMGLPDPNKPKDPELYSVVTLLRSALNVALPEDVTRDNFLSSLKLVLTQKLADKQESTKEEGLTQRPEDAQTKSPSIAMSETIQTPVASKTEAILMGMLVKNKRKELSDRVRKLVSSGRIGKDYAEKTLLPRIEAFSMSAADLTDAGELPQSSLEDLLEGLEQAIPLAGPSLVDQGLTMDAPLDGDGVQTEELPADILSGTQVVDLSDTQIDSILNESNF